MPLIDTACGYAAVTVAGSNVLASHFSVNCLRPAQGEQFIVRSRVVKAGKTQVFTACDLVAVASQVEKLVATGETLLSVAKAGTWPGSQQARQAIKRHGSTCRVAGSP